MLNLYCLEILKEKRDNPLQKIVTIIFPKLDCPDSQKPIAYVPVQTPSTYSKVGALVHCLMLQARGI